MAGGVARRKGEDRSGSNNAYGRRGLWMLRGGEGEFAR